jgi:hypothetical protein
VSNNGTITNEKIAKIDLTENEPLLPNEITYVEIIKPKNKLPLSPINILAGLKLKNKNTRLITETLNDKNSSVLSLFMRAYK